MASALLLLAEGFEEIEAVVVIDVLRRADVSVTTAALTEKRVTGAHGIVVEADRLLDDLLESAVDGVLFDAVLLPGGMPGSRHLREDARVQALVVHQANRGCLVGAICAAPTALEAAGILNGRAATSFPGCELPSAEYKLERVVVDGNIVTSRGPGTAFEFALTLAELLASPAVAMRLREGMLVQVR